MRFVFLFAALLLMFVSCNEPKPANVEKPNTDSLFWTDDKAKAHLADLNTASTWDTAMLKDDIEFAGWKSELPISLGAFPTPVYDRVGKGSFKGIGFYGQTKYIQGKSIAVASFVVNKSPVNQGYIKPGKNNEVYFTIAVLTDKADTVNYTHTMNNVVSRNHPDYIGQGYVKYANLKVDYTAFLTAGRNSYATVNMRLFDLKNGAFILIAPHKDNSLRSLQMQVPALSTDDVESYIDSLFKQQKAINFFTEEGTI